MNTLPQALPTHTQTERFLSKTVHVVLYILLIGMPLSGLIFTWAGGYPASFFGLFDIPSPIAKNHTLHEVFQELHEVMAYGLVGLLALHIAGALKHHWIDKDNTARRMGAHPLIVVPLLLLFIGGGVLAIREPIEELFGEEEHSSEVRDVESYNESSQEMHEGALNSGLAPDHESIMPWVIDSQASRIEFSVEPSGESKFGQAVSGVFDHWDGQIDFDPSHLGQSHVLIRIDVGSINTGSEDRDAQARAPEWFDAAQFSQAVFESESFQHIGDDQYEVSGSLTLRGKRLPVHFPFTLKISHDDDGDEPARADMDADLSLNRLDYGVGQGQWENGDYIGANVELRLTVRATRSDS